MYRGGSLGDCGFESWSRHQDGRVSSLGMLSAIVDAVLEEPEILGSGIRCGADIAKDRALGAKCCLVGEPCAYGLALGGEDGVNHVLKALTRELDLTLHSSGIPSVSRDVLNRKQPLRGDEL